MLDRLGRLTFRFRWAVVGFWFLVFTSAALIAPRVTTILRGGGYSIGNSQSVQAYNELHRAYGYRALTFTVVFQAPRLSRSRLYHAAQVFRQKARARYGGALTVDPPVWTPDRRVIFERVYSQPRSDFGAGFATGLHAMYPGAPVRTYLTGSSEIFHDMEVVTNQDLHQIELVTLPLALFVLLIIFGSAVASALPVLMAPVSVTIALAMIYLLGQRTDMSIFVLNTTSMLGLGVAIDYSLFMVNRFREEITNGRPLEEAVGRTVATSGRAILISALVVSTGFFGLMLSRISMLTSIGIGGTLVTVISLLVALSLLPALLGILGPRVNLLPVVPQRLTQGHIWSSIARAVMRRPVGVIAAVAAVIALLAIPAFHLRVGIPGPEILPPSVESHAGNDVLNHHLGIVNHAPILVVVKRLPGTNPSTARTAAFALLDRACSSSEVAAVSIAPVPDSPRQLLSCSAVLAQLQKAASGRSATALASKRNVGLLSVLLRSSASSAAAEAYVSRLRHAPPLPGYQVLVGGQTAGQMDFDHYLYSRFPFVVLFVVGTIYVVLLIAFRSVLLPLKAVLMNAFSLVAAYGCIVFAFQDGHLSRLLDFTPVGNIDSIVPVLLFCVLFGVSTDYEVFLLSRIQEEYQRTGDNEESVARGLAVTGRIITSAATIMVIVFFAFAFARLVVIKEVGLGLGVAVFVDATLIRALLVPATMRLLGRWNWWLPGRGFLRSSAVRAPVGHSAAGE